MKVEMPPFNRETVEAAFQELGERALVMGEIVEIAVYGGAALLLAYTARQATRDVDAVFDASKNVVKMLASEMAEEHGWPEDWLNDGVKGWLSQRDNDPDSKSLFKSYPSEENPGLRVFVPSPRYLLAMKCMAMRIEGALDESPDIKDIRELAKIAGVKSADEALDLVGSFYPTRMIEPKTQFGIMEIFSSDEAGNSKDPKP